MLTGSKLKRLVKKYFKNREQLAIAKRKLFCMGDRRSSEIAFDIRHIIALRERLDRRYEQELKIYCA